MSGEIVVPKSVQIIRSIVMDMIPRFGPGSDGPLKYCRKYGHANENWRSHCARCGVLLG